MHLFCHNRIMIVGFYFLKEVKNLFIDFWHLNLHFLVCCIFILLVFLSHTFIRLFLFTLIYFLFHLPNFKLFAILIDQVFVLCNQFLNKLFSTNLSRHIITYPMTFITSTTYLCYFFFKGRLFFWRRFFIQRTIRKHYHGAEIFYFIILLMRILFF